MRLATLRNGSRDGQLVVVSRDGLRYAKQSIAPTLQSALDDWDRVSPLLSEAAKTLESHSTGESLPQALEAGLVAAPLPRAYEWVDGSAYINHIILVRKARGAEPPPNVTTDPLVYQGGSSTMLGPRDAISVGSEAWGPDFESEVCVVLGDVPAGTVASNAAAHVKLVMLANDVSLRNLIPAELTKGFGFFQSKPSTAFSPFAVTPDELGSAYRDGRVHLPLRTWLNDALAGDPNAGPEMHFSFFDLIAHISKTRAFGAGTILGSGTVSNDDEARGVSCLVERRMRETLAFGEPRTPFLKHGDRVRLDMSDDQGRSIFGTIDQRVECTHRIG